MRPITTTALAAAAALSLFGAAEAQDRGPRMDADGDGKITLQEFKTGRGERMFARLDADGDGKLSKTELAAPLQRAPQGADVAFAALDADKDGFVSHAEAEAMAAAAFTRADTDGDGALSGEEIDHVRQGLRPGGPRQ